MGSNGFLTLYVFSLQLGPGSQKVAHQHRDGVDTTSALNLDILRRLTWFTTYSVDAKGDFDQFGGYLYVLLLLF